MAALTAVLGAQQAPDPQGPAAIFEVASVKSNKSGGVSGGIQWLPGGRLSAESFDINAKAAEEVRSIPNGLSPIQMQMLRTLLADRFKLATHTEMREPPIYALMARPDGEVGPR